MDVFLPSMELLVSRAAVGAMMSRENRRLERLRTDDISRRHFPRLDEEEDIDNRWHHAVELWDVIRPAWWPVLVTLIICFLVVGNAQIRDVLAAVSLEHRGHVAEGEATAGLSGRYWTTFFACAAYSFFAWAFTRGLLSVRFPYTPCPFDPPDWHVVVRVYAARAIGLLLPASCAFAYLTMGMGQEGFFYIGLCIGLLFLYWFSRRYIYDWLQEQEDLDEAEERARQTGEALSEEDASAAAKAETLGDIDEALEEAEETLDEAARTKDVDLQRRLLSRVAALADRAGIAVKAVGDDFQETELFDQTMPARFSAKMSVLLYGILAVHFITAVIFFVWPVSAPQSVGAAAILFLAFAGGLSLGTFLFSYWSRFSKLPPAVFLFAIWMTIASNFNDNHEIARLPADETPSFVSPNLEDYIDLWLYNRQGALPREIDDPMFPIFIVAAEGGGARAAYWTGTVLSQLNSVEPASGLAARDHMFLISGVSGGALGAATFGASLVTADENDGDSSTYVQRFLSQDFLSPVTAGALYHDFMTDFVPVPLSMFDRARWLEGAWREGWKRVAPGDAFSEDFRAFWDHGRGRARLGETGAVPLLTYNTTSVRTGAPWTVAPVRYSDRPGCSSQDFVDLIDHDDRGMSLATAAHLSARFTGISPAGRISLDINGFTDCPADGFDRFVDGAYFENSGADVAVQVLRQLEDQLLRFCKSADEDGVLCLPERMPIIPVAVIARQPEASDPPDVLHETTSILMTVANTRIARGSDSLQRLALAANGELQTVELDIGWSADHEALGCRPYPDAVLTAFQPGQSVGQDRTVPLGWTLSQAAVDHMCRQRLSNPVLERLMSLLEQG